MFVMVYNCTFSSCTRKMNRYSIYNDKLYNDKRKFNPPEYKIGDLVNITDKRNVLSKGDTTNWSYELSKIYEMVNYEPPQYLIANEQGEKILGKNY